MNKEEVWERALALWNRLREMPDMNIKNINIGEYERSFQSNFKNSILEELGYDRCESGCPFCEEYYHRYDDIISECNDCPISFGERLNCAFNTPYSNWANSITMNYIHRQELANDFYEWLKIQHEKV